MVVIESINTGRIWEFSSHEQVWKFMHGRNARFYRIHEIVESANMRGVYGPKEGSPVHRKPRTINELASILGGSLHKK